MSELSIAVFAGVSIVASLLTGDLVAQENRPRRALPPVCSGDCGIVAASQRSLPGQSAIAQLAPRGVIQALAAGGGTFFVATLDLDSPLLMVGVGGQVARIGRSGDGPGEFRAPLVLFDWADDTIGVFDRQLGRLTLVHSSGRIGPTRPFPRGTVSAAALPMRAAVVSAAFRTPSSIGLPLHIVDSVGVVQRSIGLADQRYSDEFRTMRSFLLGRRRAGFVSVRRAGAYEWTIWNSAGRPMSNWSRTASWYRPYEQLVSPTPDAPPQPYTSAAVAEGDSLLWIAVAVPGPQWSKALGAPIDQEGQRVFPIQDMSGYYSTRVELIQLRDGRVVGSVLVPGFHPFFAAPGLLLRQSKDDDGMMVAELVKLRRVPVR